MMNDWGGILLNNNHNKRGSLIGECLAANLGCYFRSYRVFMTVLGMVVQHDRDARGRIQQNPHQPNPLTKFSKEIFPQAQIRCVFPSHKFFQAQIRCVFHVLTLQKAQIRCVFSSHKFFQAQIRCVLHVLTLPGAKYASVLLGCAFFGTKYKTQLF
jgi:hypothetical protein